MADDLISDEKKKIILNDFIQQTPPGQFNNVFKNVRTLLNNDDILRAEGAKTAMKYRLDQMAPVVVEDETVLVSQYGVCQSTGHVLAPGTRKLFSYDPVRGEAIVVPGEPDASSEAFEEYRSPVAKSVQSYVTQHYPHGVSTVYAKQGAESDSVLVTVLIECHQYQIQNYWTGNWRSVWNVTFNKDDNSAQINGTMKVQVHYYEDGNVQLITNKSSEGKVRFSSRDELASELVKKIEELENAYQLGIVAAYSKFTDSTFKQLRRPLPVTHAKINWDQLAAYKIGAELSKNQ
jgi:capping protein alpha